MKLLKQTPIPRQAHSSYEPTDPKNPAPEGWGDFTGMAFGWGSTDVRYPRHVAPDPLPLPAETRLTVWRGERASAQLVLASGADFGEVRVRVKNLPFASARFVRYVRAGDALVPDILDDADAVALPAKTVRSVWVSVEPGPNVKPGVYRGALSVRGRGFEIDVPLAVTVSARTLPPPKDWGFYLDLWQNPYALARWHRVAPFSPEHLALLRPHFQLLASAGQKVLTATILHDPWGGQTFDPYGSMVEWAKTPDGAFSWDFSLFDRYVSFGKSCGLGPFVNCYSLIPWTNKLRFRNPDGTFGWLDLKPGEASYEEAFGPFLQAFEKHLKAKGWLGQVRIAMDERPLPVMRAAFAVVKKHAPGIPIALAGEARPEFKDFVEDWCMAFEEVPPELLAARRRAGKPTTYYVCCNPLRPNTFTFSPPAEAHWLGLYAAAKGYTGFLRWAYDSFTEDPFFDTQHTTWPAGDCFVVYPGARSSIRFERLREGIQDFEKIRILRAAGADLRAVDAALASLSIQKAQTEEVAPQVNAVRDALARLA